MIGDKRVLGIIPARGGSKGIKNKNIIEIDGKPLIAYSIKAAADSRYIDRVIVSTDSWDIEKVSKEYGGAVPFMRPDDISGDSAKSMDVVKHAVGVLESQGDKYHVIVLLQPTSPLRTGLHIDEALEMFSQEGCESVVSVCACDKNPVLIRELIDGKLKEVISYDGENLRRQDLPEYYTFNGAIYVNTVEMIEEKGVFVDEDTFPYIMSREDSVDIDEPVDVLIAEYYLKRRYENEKR